MKTYVTEDVISALRACGIRSGEVLLVHSALFRLGRMQDIAPRQVPQRLAGIIQDVLGPAGTLAVPAFQFGFCRGEPFDVVATPSQGMGVFSETIRRQQGACRSHHPMQSLAAVGHRAEWLCEPDTPSSFSADGPFQRLLELDARLLLLGAEMQAASLIHLVEERLEVPYRFWKSFTSRWSHQDTAEVRTYRMFVRDLQRDPRLVLSRLESWLSQRELLKIAPLGSGLVKCCRARDFVDVATEYLNIDPEALLADRAA